MGQTIQTRKRKGSFWNIYQWPPTLQDYTGSFEFGAYREEYEKYKDLLTMGYVIYLEGIWKEGYGGGRYFFTILDVRLMASLSQDLTKSITLITAIDKIDGALSKGLKNICEINKGDHKLKIKVLDIENKVSQEFEVTNKTVEANSQFIEEAMRLGFRYELN